MKGVEKLLEGTVKQMLQRWYCRTLSLTCDSGKLIWVLWRPVRRFEHGTVSLAIEMSSLMREAECDRRHD